MPDDPQIETPPADDDADAVPATTDAVLAAIGDAVPGARREQVRPPTGPVQDVFVVDRDAYPALVAAAYEAGYDVFVDLCAVDYLRRDPRFEVVLILLDHDERRRLRIRAGVPGDDPSIASITGVFPGANFYEREAFDLFGIGFDGHPDLTRILLPDDWDGHPLRKDYPVGSVPVQFKEAHKVT